MGKRKQVSKKDAKILELKAQVSRLQIERNAIGSQLETVDSVIRSATFQGSSEVEWLKSFQALVLHLARIRGIGPTPYLDFGPVVVPPSTHDPNTGEPIVRTPQGALIDRLVAEDTASGTHSLMSTDEVTRAT